MTFEIEKEILAHVIEELDKLRDMLDKNGRLVLAWQVENFKPTYFVDSNFEVLADGVVRFKER